MPLQCSTQDTQQQHTPRQSHSEAIIAIKIVPAMTLYKAISVELGLKRRSDLMLQTFHQYVDSNTNQGEHDMLIRPSFEQTG